MYISEVMTGAPGEERGPLEMKTYEALKKYSIPFTRVDNDAVEAMEDCQEIAEKLGTEIRKTIVLCNRKKTLFFLVVLPADKHFDTKTFCAKTGAPHVSFASAESMEAKLGVVPGSATVMSVLNDPERAVQVVIDREVAEAEWFGCNPGANTTHIRMETSKLLNVLLPKLLHKPMIAAL